MTQAEIKKVIRELVRFITEDTIDNPYGLSMTSFFWPERKVWNPKIAEFDDIGDFLTFVNWAAEILNRPELDRFVEKQIDKWSEYASLPGGWYIEKINCEKPLPNKLFQPTTSVYGHQDAILGFYELYALTRKKKYMNKLKRLLRNCIEVGKKHDGTIPNQIIHRWNVATPWSSVSPMVNGLIAEHAYLMFRESREQIFQKLGDEIIEWWLGTPLWKSQQLFHQGYNAFLPLVSPYQDTKIMKENSNMIYAILARPEKYELEIKQFTSKLLTFQYKSGPFFSKWSLKGEKIIKDGFDKTQNFAIIDLLTEIATKTKIKNKEALVKSAKSCANFWIERKNIRTNLIPDYFTKNGQPKYLIAKLDQSADLYSSFLRLFTSTGNKGYLREAEVGAKALKNYFGQKEWWWRIVSTKTGKPAEDVDVPRNDRPAGRNLTKYVGGALRFYLSLHEVKLGKSMQDDEFLRLLSRDR